jgi:3-methylcrotonyl-CoA carboxylase alpha subunit
VFDKVLIANRGEIACRIIETCRRLGVATVAVYSSADRNALYVERADEAVRLGAAPSSESYLNIDRIVTAARDSGAQAIHPGYGFLSENAGFADACADAGIVFIGPTAAAIRAMASKAEAKRIMAAAGVPVLAGDPDASQNDASLARAAEEAGYPVIVKPALGGGGRGMRVVHGPDGLVEALAAGRREAKAAFGDDGLLIEKYLPHARHVEVQVFGDRHGNVVHLFERDCSVQRRHQKVIEEAPAPNLDDATRRALCAAAVTAAGAVGYVGAGTVEFLVGADGDFRFIEMNTRLQVEHPVTEAVTGIDLVEWQLRIASGEPLPVGQADIACRGHAVEARLYAEDPAADFRPGFGRIAHLAWPEDEGIRVDTGIREGDIVTVDYDPMVAKIVAHAGSREAACDRLSAALASLRLAGPMTNERFLRAIVDHRDFRTGVVDTGFLVETLDDLIRTDPVPDPILALAALSGLTGGSTGSNDPWSDSRGWRLGGGASRRIEISANGENHSFSYRAGELLRDGQPLGADFPEGDVYRDGNRLTVFADGDRYVAEIVDPLTIGDGAGSLAGSLRSTMPGIVVATPVAEGERVAAGTVLIVIEAMKVEHSIRAPADGTVVAMPFAVGDRVSEGIELVVFEAD